MYKMMTVVFLSAAALGGCSAAEGYEAAEGDSAEGARTETDSAGDDIDGEEVLDSFAQALVTDRCGAITPQDATSLSLGQAATKSPPYGIAGCPNSHLFLLNHTGSFAGTTVAYAGTLPTNQADCQRIEVSQITFESNGVRVVGSRTVNRGFWTGTRCSGPITGSPRLNPQAGPHRHWVQALNASGQAAAVRVTLFPVN
jgi:hypothetical protein